MSNDDNLARSNRILQYLRDELTVDVDERFMLMLMQQHQMLMEVGMSYLAGRTHTRTYLDREREVGHYRLFNDYFSDQPVYTDEMFRRRFQMRRELFLGIVEKLQNHSEYFPWRIDAMGRMDLSPLQKCTAALLQLAYGAPSDQSDEYLRLAETTAIDYLINFCKCVYEVFGDQYLRRPTVADTQHLLEMHERRHGFPDMLGSRNDINVLYESPLFNKVLEGGAPEVYFTINDTTYTKGYYLTDGIYPTWATFVKSFPYPKDPKRKKFKERQETARKDVERVFGVLQARWTIVRGPVRYWSRDILRDIMYTCIILHNMIIEDEGDAVSNWMGYEENHPTRVKQGFTPEFQEYLWRNCELCDSEIHHQLRVDLAEHI
ncbi:uncharacterized protein LOC121978550 [Zingiber officinale]|uniref:uncharacterized protein LOC121978550 n=1 Tax=Zingiber officinale TaxID=94328 RepID=UPI001C4AC114|nr:uncharacterized protein LOC121978550 [Zingiber officinale]